MDRLREQIACVARALRRGRGQGCSDVLCLRKIALCCLIFNLPAYGQSGEPPKMVNVVNGGIPGENSTELRARFDGELQRTHPRYVIVYSGINDAVNDKKFTTEQEYGQNIGFFVERARRLRVSLVLVALQPVDEVRLMQRHAADAYGSRPPNVRIDALDRRLEQIARKHRVPLVRFDQVLMAAGGPNEQLSTDGVHLSIAGYGLLAGAVRRALPAAIAPGTTLLCLGDSLTFGQAVRPQGAGLADPDGHLYRTYPQQLAVLLQGSARPADVPR